MKYIINDSQYKRLTEDNDEDFETFLNKKYPNIGKSRIGIKRPDISKLLKGVRLSDTVRSNMSVPKGPQAIKTCPHCGKSGGNAMTRHHFNNCKTITNINGENSQAK